MITSTGAAGGGGQRGDGVKCIVAGRRAYSSGMSRKDGKPSLGQRVYARLFRIYGPAEISARDSPETELADSAVQQTADLEQWEKETDGTRTWLVRRKSE